MAYAKFVIKVNLVPSIADRLTIVDDSYAAMGFLFQDNRTTIGTIPLEPNPTIANVAFRIYQYFGIDYNILGLYQVNFNSATNEITVTAKNAGVVFTEILNTTGGAITTTITPESAVTPKLQITNIAVSEADTNPCANVKLTITTDVQANSIINPVSGVVTTNPHVFDTARANLIFILMGKTGYINADAGAKVPLLLSAYFSLEILNTPSGGGVNVLKLSPLNQVTLLSLEYSLDGVTWQTSSGYSGLAEGSYTMYIRDNIGCQITIPFEIEAFSANLVDYDPIAEISNVNSFRFKINETIEPNGTRRNLMNSLSFEEQTDINNRDFKQIFQTGDIIKTQFKSNYSTNEATLVDCQGNETPLSVSAVTDNLNKSDVRDGTIVLGQENNAIGISFVAGNTYDPTTFLQDGSYNLGSSIMDWVNAGDYLNIEGFGWFSIKTLKQPTQTNPYTVVVLNVTNFDLGLTEGAIHRITTVYNAVDYNRHEFTVPMSSLLGDYYIKVNISDADFGAKEFISEWFNVAVEQDDKHYLIDYYNSENNEINYATGITYRLRIPYLKPLTWKPNNEQEVYITDTKTLLIESVVREFYDFATKPMPVAIAQKVVLALSHDKIMIDGITYILEGGIEAIPYGMTNLYQLKGTLIKSNYVFENNTGITLSEVLLPSDNPLKLDANSVGLLLIN